MKTVLAGKEFNFRTDNEKVLQMAADLVNSEMESLGKKLFGESQATIAVIAALNIAEKYYLETEQIKFDRDFLQKELKRMTDQLDQQMNHK